MTAPLALTKLRCPRLRPNLVTRTHLIDRLNEGLRQNRKLTVLTAPAGFGKTTLVAGWLKQLDRPSAWVCLDEGDNDPVRFLTLVVAALQTVEASLGRSLQSLLQAGQLASNASALAQQDEAPSAIALVTVLINDLIKASRPLVLVLDDYHVISRGSSSSSGPIPAGTPAAGPASGGAHA